MKLYLKHVRQILREQRAAQSLLDAVVEGDSVIDRATLENVDYRSESFFLDDVGVAGQARYYRRFHVKSGTIYNVSTELYHTAAGYGFSYRKLQVKKLYSVNSTIYFFYW